MIESVHVGIQVSLEVLGADSVVHPVDAPLDIAPHPLDIVGVDPSHDVLLGRVLDRLVRVAQAGEAVIAQHFIGVDRLACGDMLLNHRKESPSLDIGDYLDYGWAAPLDHAGNDGLALGSTPALSRTPAADVGFVNCNFAEEDDIALGHELADLGEHPPGGLVGDADLPLKLLGRYAGSGRSHEEHGVEPGAKGCRGFVEDGISCGRYVRAAELAAVDLPARDAKVLGDPVALGASDTIGPSSILEEVQAGIVVGELLVKRFDRVLFHEPMVSEKVRAVKG